MTRIFMIAGISLVLTSPTWAQSAANCDQIRDAIAQYGYESARQHALIHYGAEAVEAGEKNCGIKEAMAKPPATKASLTKTSAKHQPPKKHKPAPRAVEAQQK